MSRLFDRGVRRGPFCIPWWGCAIGERPDGRVAVVRFDTHGPLYVDSDRPYGGPSQTSGSHGQCLIFAECSYGGAGDTGAATRSEEHTSELQSRGHLVCRLLLEKKKTTLENTNKETLVK